MRTIRQVVPHVVYHLISRFVGEEWFVKDHEDRDTYLRLLARSMQESDWRCLAYAVMSNHIHLAMLAGESPLADWARRVHSPFADWLNSRRSRIGPIFVRGPKAYAVPAAKVSDVIAYIHNNPVRAGVVARASDSPWTSHRAYVGLESRPWLCVEEGLVLSHLEAANFDVFVGSSPGDPCRVDVRAARKAAARLGAIEVATPTGGVGVVPLVTKPSARVRIDPRWIVDQVGVQFGVSPLELGSRRRNPTLCDARRVAVHAALRLGVVGADIAAALGITPGAVSRIRHAEVERLRAVIEVVVSRLRALVGATQHPSLRGPMIA